MTEMKNFVSHKQASQLLHNKFVVVLGDSIQRAVYKDLVLLLQKERFLTLKQLRSKGEMSFEQDCLIEGGCLRELHNGTAYREVRQFQSNHHLVRFYFVTRVYSQYMLSVLEDFRQSLKPDVVIINSCIWDISRYSRNWTVDYKENLHMFFEELKKILPEETLIIWNLTMPLGEKIKGGFLVPEIKDMVPRLRYDVIEANFYSGTLADSYKIDAVDLHFHFRFFLDRRSKDGVHWDNVAHRKITTVLLQHAAEAWGVALPSFLAASEHTVKEVQFSTNTNKSTAAKRTDRRPMKTNHNCHREVSHSRYHGNSRNPPVTLYSSPIYRSVPLPPPPSYCRYSDDGGRFRHEDPFTTAVVQMCSSSISEKLPFPPFQWRRMLGRVPLPPPPCCRFPFEKRPVEIDFISGSDFNFEPYRQDHHQDVLRMQHASRRHYAPYCPRRRDRYNHY